MFTKISILLQYGRIFTLREMRIPLHIVMAICVAWGPCPCLLEDIGAARSEMYRQQDDLVCERQHQHLHRPHRGLPSRSCHLDSPNRFAPKGRAHGHPYHRLVCLRRIDSTPTRSHRACRSPGRQHIL